MRRSILIAVVTLIAATGLGAGLNAPILAQARPSARLLGSFADWTATSAASVAPISTTTVNGQGATVDPVVLREYGLQSVERREYSHAGQTAVVALYTLRDPSSAYGVYTLLRNDSLTPVALGSFGSVAHDRALIVRGNLLLDVTAKDARPSDADLKQLDGSLEKIADRTPFPIIGEHLPELGRVRRSEHYFLGPRSLSQYVPLGTDDWVGFDHSAEAITATYHLEGKDLTLLISSYPTQQIAADKFDGMLRRFTFDPPEGVNAAASDHAVLFGKRSSSLVAVVINAPSRDVAEKLLDQINYQSQVTWDEPKHTLTDPSITSIVIGAFLGTGAIMLLALAVGIGFGGLRVLMKVFLPNKVFDREKQIEILQLGIYSKPIQAKDFYQKS